MNAHNLARMAYAEAATPIRTDRGTEFEAFARVTRTLKSAEAKGKPGFKELAQAVLENRRLWTILAADVANPENGLPDDLRARIFYLAEFTDQHSSQVLSGTASPEILVDINTAIMRGLGAGGAR